MDVTWSWAMSRCAIACGHVSCSSVGQDCSIKYHCQKPKLIVFRIETHSGSSPHPPWGCQAVNSRFFFDVFASHFFASLYTKEMWCKYGLSIPKKCGKEMWCKSVPLYTKEMWQRNVVQIWPLYTNEMWQRNVMQICLSTPKKCANIWFPIMRFGWPEHGMSILRAEPSKTNMHTCKDKPFCTTPTSVLLMKPMHCRSPFSAQHFWAFGGSVLKMGDKRTSGRSQGWV